MQMQAPIRWLYTMFTQVDSGKISDQQCGQGIQQQAERSSRSGSSAISARRARVLPLLPIASAQNPSGDGGKHKRHTQSRSSCRAPFSSACAAMAQGVQVLPQADQASGPIADESTTNGPWL